MNLFKQNGYWWVNFRDAGDKRRRVPTKVRVGGQAEEAEANAEAARIVQRAFADVSACVKPSSLSPTLGIALERTYREHWSAQKQAHVMQRVVGRLVREIGHWSVTETNYARLKDYAEGLRRDGYAHATINRRMSAISTALGEALRRGEIERRPDMPHYTENNRKDRYMSAAEEQAVFDWLKRKAAAEAYDPQATGEWMLTRMLGIFLLDTGFRFSEAFKFKIEGDKACVTDTKNGKARRVPLTKRASTAAKALLEMALYAQLAADRRPKAAWDYVDHRWSQATAAAGCEDVTLHILRHTCASRLVQRNVSLYVVKEWLGHSSIKVTERYGHLGPDSLAGALAALEQRPVGVKTAPEREVTTGHAITPLREAL